MSVAVIERERLVSTAVLEQDKPVSSDSIAIGSRICVTSYSPFRGFRGTVLGIYRFEVPDEHMPDELCFCIYRVQLDGFSKQETIELPTDDVELFIPVTR